MATNQATASDPTINILLATFAGLGLPRTLSLQTKPSASVADVYASILHRLPCSRDSLVITTVSNKQLASSSDASITTLLDSPNDRLLSLRLSRRLCGGKGGFGSQLRAAGGRMSSRKNRDRNNQNVNGSNRNLDGRRLRTVDEAKRLADYLAIKPEMEKKEREERKKRWEAVVEAAERREDEIRNGKTGAAGSRLDATYVESKELAEEKTREAILKAMREGTLELARTGSESSADSRHNSEDDAGEGSSDTSSKVSESKAFFGWDEEDDDEDEDEGEDEDGDEGEDDEREEGKDQGLDGHISRNEEPPAAVYKGKGKSRAT